MQPILISAVILGNWNPKIFTPFWIKTQLFEVSEKEEIQVSFDYNDLEFGFQYQNLVISPRNNLLDIRVQSMDNFLMSEEKNNENFASIVMKLFELLPQTPIKAMGVNIVFSCPISDENPNVSIISKVPDYLEGFETGLVRKTKVKDNYTINILSEKKDNSIVNVAFNFHYPKIIKFEKTFIGEHIKESNRIMNYGK